MPSTASVGIVGGSGFADIEALADRREVHIATPFGPPSDAFTLGTLHGIPLAFLPRHGRGHRIQPSDLNARANIYGFKRLGVEHLISISACGSLREELAPQHILVPDQLYDHTKRRIGTFFGDGIVAHVGFAQPFCPTLSQILFQIGQDVGVSMHQGGTYICMEGPQFSTRAESEVYRGWGMDVIGMTAVPEAKLAREAEICYATLACVTDYDVWHDTEEAVTVEMVIENLQHNVEHAKAIVGGAIQALPAERGGCPCPDALANAIITAPDSIPAAQRATLDLIVGKYI
jgi:5'-methylthioadenosine phosphorylase